VDEIRRIVADFEHAAECALQAGFDGVEIHSANGYLLHQFLSDRTNKRTDRYGGSVENRARFVLEIVDAVSRVWSPSKVGIRLSPLTRFGDITESNPEPLYAFLVSELGARQLVYIHLIEGDTQMDRNPAGGFDLQRLRREFRGRYIGNNGYDLALAIEARQTGRADLIAFGRPFIANPDLVDRLRTGAPLTEPDRETFYSGEAKGYIDYPAMSVPALS